MNELHLSIRPSLECRFTPLLEKGVGLTVTINCTLRELLCGQLGLTDEYLDQRIQTIFLNARPVDNVDQVIVRNESILALSAAMPGILGATMRKGGRYAAFRKSISQQPHESDASKQSGRITIKMFNMVAKEVGSCLLTAGVEVDGKDLYHVVRQLPEKLSDGIIKMYIDGQDIKPEMTSFKSLSKNRMFLFVTVCDRQR